MYRTITQVCFDRISCNFYAMLQIGFFVVPKFKTFVKMSTFRILQLMVDACIMY